MTNKGTTTLTITKIYVGGSNSPDFAFQSNTCYPSVSAGASCTITDQFRPSQSGAETAYISIADSATGSPQLVNMTGTGVSSSLSVSLSPTSLSFGSQNIGTTSAGQNVTLTNTGSAALSISSIAVTGSNNGDFAQTNSCGSSLAAGANCTHWCDFHADCGTGSRSASVTITDNATGSPQTFHSQRNRCQPRE